MPAGAYRTIGPDRPMGDREGAEEDWTPERVEEISKEEVRNPGDSEDVDEHGPDDPSKD
jgi:hypothetical protein